MGNTCGYRVVVVSLSCQLNLHVECTYTCTCTTLPPLAVTARLIVLKYVLPLFPASVYVFCILYAGCV